MEHEKIFEREDGSKVKLTAVLDGEMFLPHKWKFKVSYLPKRKKNWEYIDDWNNQEFRYLQEPAKSAAIINKKLQFVTPEEVLETQLELWEKIKPTLLIT